MRKKRNTKDLRHVVCPVCGYKMPVFYKDMAQCEGMMVSCKGRNCHAFFEVKVKDGKQVR